MIRVRVRQHVSAARSRLDQCIGGLDSSAAELAAAHERPLQEAVRGDADALAEKQTPDPRYLKALSAYVAFLVTTGTGGEYGVEDILNTSGFVGLALLEMLSFGVTFGPTSA